MCAAPKIRILLVDDHFAIRVGLAASLGFEPDLAVIAEAGTGREALILDQELLPDVIILDWRLPDLSGVETARAIRAKRESARILMFSVYEGEEDVFQAIRAGASGYLLKSADRSELLAAIRATHRGERFLPKSLQEKLDRRLGRGVLTEREFEVLERIVRGLANKEIAAELGLAEITIKQHVSSVLDKLSVKDRTQAATAAIQRGIVHLE